MFVIPIGASSNIVQLRTILSNNHFSFLFSNSIIIIILARIIINILETRDMNMVLNLFISLILNISIVIAFTVYKTESKDKTT